MDGDGRRESIRAPGHVLELGSSEKRADARLLRHRVLFWSNQSVEIRSHHVLNGIIEVLLSLPLSRNVAAPRSSLVVTFRHRHKLTASMYSVSRTVRKCLNSTDRYVLTISTALYLA